MRYNIVEIDDTTVSGFVTKFAPVMMVNEDSIIVRPVLTKREMSDFVGLPRRMYRGNPMYVPDLDVDVRATFNPRKNAGLAFCDIQPFVAYRHEVPLGRIVGIINHRANEKWGTRNVRFGFIEFIHDMEVASALLAAVETWGRERGMSRIQGPMGITDFDKEGMLVEDFGLEGSMTAIYNPSYYHRFLEALGYQKEVDWLQVRVRIPEEVPAKYARVARLAKEMFQLRVHIMTSGDVRGDYARRVFGLLNQCYSPLFGFTEFTTEQMENFMRKYVLLIDRRMMPVVENERGEVIGVAVTMGSLSQALRQSRGKLLPLGWWRLLRTLKWRPADHAEMLLVAVRPDYQGLGVNALFFDYLIPLYNRLGIRWAETGPQLEDNLKVLSQWKPLSPKIVKRRRCYYRDLKQ